MRENLCPTSSMANSFIAQSINVECAKYLIKNNVEVPVSSSLNCDGNEDHNEKYFHQYTRMYWGVFMNKIELLDKIRGELVISCQAFEGNPFYGADNMVKWRNQ